MTVGIVAVSHSKPLAEAARDLALQMISGEQPPLAVAAGTADGGFGTDAVAVSEAIAEVENGDGTVVLVDLGSAILSAEMALEFLPDPDARVEIVAAPFVEGLLAAVVRAATGGSVDEVAVEARGALLGKQEQLGQLPESAGADRTREVHIDLTAELHAPKAAQSAEKIELASSTVTLINPAGLHARPAAQLAELAGELNTATGFAFTVAAKHKKTGDERIANLLSPLAVAALGTRADDSVTVAATTTAQLADAAQADDSRQADTTVQQQRAAEAVAQLVELIASGFGEADTATAGAGQVADSAAAADSTAGAGPAVEQTGADRDASEPSRSTKTARAIGVSSGRVTATAQRMAESVTEPPAEPAATRPDPATETDRLREAISAVVTQLETRQVNDPEAAAIVAATAKLAADPLIPEEAAPKLAVGLTAERAVWEVLTDLAANYAEAGGQLAERATDVRDVRNRIVAELTGQPAPGIPEPGEPFILVARDLAPADTAVLDPQTCIGMVLGEGGPTSHTAIIARALGIAAVVDPSAYQRIATGDTVLVDGDSAEVLIGPSEAEQKTARRSAQNLADLPPFTAPAATSCGYSVDILANVGKAADAALGVERGARGTGLFRTEFCFLGRQTAPSLDEQIAVYSAVLEHFRGSKAVIRTLDAGSDKPLPFVTPDAEANPALGVRGYRTADNYPEVLTTQLRAIAAAAAATGVTPWVMAPMISTTEEAAEFASLAREHGLQQVGVMVETPAAALITDQLFEHINFVSIGTNDLTQYTMAADRLATELAHLNTPWQPAVLRMIREIGRLAAGRPVGVCGEAAADPLLARVLVGLGVNSLSMSPQQVPLVGSAVNETSLADCQRAAEAACNAQSPSAARQRAAELLG
ncbi:phosphoenolpyruvate--protein phosphotransferase [Leucobacter sp. OH1287]|uniref:phosphoenolpyruvate--protein phosphotransferase n=1 Tax=Leucobacter sp. OH1287 TaxID=2491049 RepID=UPI000F5EF09B|nr:phosphoenolpyruvate--protein phosphotransferase [Leucobacter sp. OH1287]RRD60520.1 phosphoenolpyruvate--protein phosphotransferase [Leucobacter sp. OH1287]